MQLSTREAEEIFSKLRVEAKRSSHHVAGFVVVNGVKVLPVHYSFGKKALPGNVPQRFRQSLRLTTPEFANLKSCKLSRDDYIELLRLKGILDQTIGHRADG